MCNKLWCRLFRRQARLAGQRRRIERTQVRREALRPRWWRRLLSVPLQFGDVASERLSVAVRLVCMRVCRSVAGLYDEWCGMLTPVQLLPGNVVSLASFVAVFCVCVRVCVLESTRLRAFGTCCTKDCEFPWVLCLCVLACVYISIYACVFGALVNKDFCTIISNANNRVR